MKVELKDRISARMLVRQCKAADLARACGVKPPSVSNWLSGKTKELKGETLLRAAAFLEVNPEWLAYGSGPVSPAPLEPVNHYEVREPARPYGQFEVREPVRPYGVDYSSRLLEVLQQLEPPARKELLTFADFLLQRQLSS